MRAGKSPWMLFVCLGALLGAGCGVRVPAVQPVERWDGQSPWGKDAGYPVLVVLELPTGAQGSVYRVVGVDAESERIVFIMQAKTLAELRWVQEKVRSKGGAFVGDGKHWVPPVPNPPPQPWPTGQNSVVQADPIEIERGLDRVEIAIGVVRSHWTEVMGSGPGGALSGRPSR